ncbi:MAG: S41 family peptidase [Anaerolineales bacterium]|nr:S41 family peptidase [Anaerolineales bacterium]
MKRLSQLFGFVAALSLALAACNFKLPFAAPTTEPVATAAPAVEQPVKISGSFDYTNSIITDYYVEHAVALVDMYGFVTRDREWEIPIASQTLGFLNLDAEAMHGEYTLQLPAKPSGMQADVDNDGQTDAGVQFFAVSYWPNLTGGPYSEGDDRSRGWPTYLASVITDTENEDEVIGGKLVVWAPDDKQQFPTGFGADGMLFTADDPVGAIPAGYSIVDLDSDPFTVSREPEPQLTLYEPQDVALKDFSALSYSEAFDKMFAIVRKEYAFNGIAGKQPDWDALYAELKPRIQQAEQDKNATAYFLALRDYTWAFKDGHVGLDGGEMGYNMFIEATKGGYGFAMRELDDGRFIVVFVLDNGPAARAGMTVGAEVTEFNGEPVGQALEVVKPWSMPHSTDWSLRYQQARYLLRVKPGTEAAVTFVNPAGEPQTTTLKAIAERDSFNATSVYANAPEDLLPVTYEYLDSGVGYIRISSNYDDLGLIIKLFERALKTFEAAEVPGIIIDMRYNSGGAPLGLAGFLYDGEIPMGQLEYYSEKTGKFEPEGLRDKVLPNENQYRFDKMVLLVGQACYSACEIESYGFSQVPDMIVVGQYPTGGVEAEVARGQFSLPEGMSLQIPTGRFSLPDGSIFLEGVGVVPTLRVPIDEATVLSAEDEVLKAGERAVLQPLGAGIVPSALPTLLSQGQTQSALNSAKMFEEKAREEYETADYLEVDRTFPFTIVLSSSETLIWAWGWCAADQARLDDNLGKMAVAFTLNGQDIPKKQFLKLDYDSSDGQRCTAYLLGLKDWKGGENHAVTTANFVEALNDGVNDFPVGYQTFEYTVYVKP